MKRFESFLGNYSLKLCLFLSNIVISVSHVSLVFPIREAVCLVLLVGTHVGSHHSEGSSSDTSFVWCLARVEYYS